MHSFFNEKKASDMIRKLCLNAILNDVLQSKNKCTLQIYTMPTQFVHQTCKFKFKKKN